MIGFFWQVASSRQLWLKSHTATQGSIKLKNPVIHGCNRGRTEKLNVAEARWRRLKAWIKEEITYKDTAFNTLQILTQILHFFKAWLQAYKSNASRRGPDWACLTVFFSKMKHFIKEIWRRRDEITARSMPACLDMHRNNCASLRSKTGTDILTLAHDFFVEMMTFCY